jgi:alpha 1,2-mannosyltransferase
VTLAFLAGFWCLLRTSVGPPTSSDTNGISLKILEFVVPSSGYVQEGVRTQVVVKRTGGGSSVCDDASSTRNNALVLLAQKKHATYGRDSLGMLVKTLDLLRDNYLSLGNHAKNVDLFLFHTGDFTDSDLVYLENRLRLGKNRSSSRAGILRLVDLNNTVYWSLPEILKNDNQASWKGSEIYPLGYRHMCRWFGMQLWSFFQDLNQHYQGGGCNYRYIARLDEDSFIHSPIDYDMFDLMQSHHYVYAYRMCSYELDETLPKLWFKKWRKGLGNESQRFIDPNLCGFYTNFFIADLEFFLSPSVAKLLKEIDRRGFYYRKRFGDLLVHSLAVYAFAQPTQIHRFLDFTYEHVTIDYFKDREKECISWGSIQAGYNDPNGETRVDEFYETYVLRKDCKTANRSYISAEDLSPTYSHIPKGKEVILKTVHAGKVELPGQGALSG